MEMPSEVVEAYNRKRNCRDKSSICHAPAYSMYFGVGGLVSACCYSKLDPLGQYPQQTISEIWFGDKIKELRGQLRRNVLPNGCEICADQLRAQNFNGLQAGHFDSLICSPEETDTLPFEPLLQNGITAVYPARLEFELSNKCNLECTMCNGWFSSSIRSNREGLPPLPQVYDGRFVEQLREFVPHLKEAKFLGGEPFLVDLYYEIWELLVELNPSCNISITTNATVYTERVKSVLETLNCQVIVSIDSLTKDTYENIRKNAVFSRTISNLEAFTAINRRKGKSLSLAVCPMVSNWQELPEMLSYANSREMRLFFNTVIDPPSLSLGYLNGTELTRIITLLRQALKPPRNTIEAHNNSVLEDYCLQLQLWIKERYLRVLVIEKLKQYLERFGKEQSGRLQSILSPFTADKGTEGCLDVFATFDHHDPKRGLREFYGGVWNVGRVLTVEGHLSSMKYEPHTLEEFLALVEAEFPETTLQELYRQSVRFPVEVVLLVGRNSPQQMIELIKAHLGARGT